MTGTLTPDLRNRLDTAFLRLYKVMQSTHEGYTDQQLCDVCVYQIENWVGSAEYVAPLFRTKNEQSKRSV